MWGHIPKCTISIYSIFSVSIVPYNLRPMENVRFVLNSIFTTYLGTMGNSAL